MGFLDHSTSNIIIDAVLTDYGRQLLAQNNGQFRIEFFSLSDDEVDYSVVQEYGWTVGKEKIAKNTPIFEAQTKGSSAIKHRMITLPNPSITRMPIITLGQAQMSADGTIDFVKNGNSWTPKAITFTQQVGNDPSIDNPDGLTDSVFTVYVSSRFLTVSQGQQLSEEPISRVAAFAIEPGVNAKEFTITLATKNLTTETFTQYGIVNSSTNVAEIVTPVTIVGDQTGLRKDFKVRIKNT